MKYMCSICGQELIVKEVLSMTPGCNEEATYFEPCCTTEDSIDVIYYQGFRDGYDEGFMKVNR